MPIFEYHLIRKEVSADTPLPIKEPLHTVDYARKYCYPKEELWREKCYAIFTDKENKPIGHFLISTGIEDKCLISPKLVIEAALQAHAFKIVLVHNHATDNPLPSVSDIEQTSTLVKALRAFSIELLDHVVLANKSYYSFTEEKTFNYKRMKEN